MRCFGRINLCVGGSGASCGPPCVRGYVAAASASGRGRRKVIAGLLLILALTLGGYLAAHTVARASADPRAATRVVTRRQKVRVGGPRRHALPIAKALLAGADRDAYETIRTPGDSHNLDRHQICPRPAGRSEDALPRIAARGGSATDQGARAHGTRRTAILRIPEALRAVCSASRLAGSLVGRGGGQL
jgi:hypothetical protein